MSTLTLYHAPVCPYARRTRFVLEHLGIPHEEVEIDLRDVPQWYRDEVNPLGRVPGIVHGDVRLFESNTINEYLEEVFQLGLMPKDPADRAQVRLRMTLADEYWLPDTGRLIKAERRGDDADEVQEARSRLIERLDFLDSLFIGDGPFLTGRRPTLADVAFFTPLPELDRLGVHVQDHSKRLGEWVHAVKALEGYPVITGEKAPGSVVQETPSS